MERGYRHYRAPREDGSWLNAPGQSTGDRQAASIDASILNEITWSGVPLGHLRHQLQIATWDRAVNAAAASLSNSSAQIERDAGGPLTSETAWWVTGHQPDLFHPGVWFKHFLLHRWQTHRGGVGLNVSVDQDLYRGLRVSVPSRDERGHWLQREVLVETVAGMSPWEFSYPRDLEAWRSFPARLTAARDASLTGPTLLDAWWPNVIESLEQGAPIGEALARARHRYQWSIGHRTLEVPMSALCSTSGFGCFVAECVLRADELRSAYNDALAAYRRHHRLKNLRHPAPPLGQRDDAIELPFWIYGRERAVAARHAAWLEKSNRAKWRLTDGRGLHWDFDPLQLAESRGEWIERELPKHIALRPRALTNTLFLRMALADEFIHGIGGGKYDQVTDRLIERLWGLVAPPYRVATATLWLPIADRPSSWTSPVPQAKAQARDWNWNPERLLQGTTSEEHDWIARKRAWHSARPTGRSAAAWHAAKSAIDDQLRRLNTRQQLDYLKQVDRAVEDERQAQVLHSREYSSALFGPEIVERLSEMARQADAASSTEGEAAVDGRAGAGDERGVSGSDSSSCKSSSSSAV